MPDSLHLFTSNFVKNTLELFTGLHAHNHMKSDSIGFIFRSWMCIFESYACFL